MACVGVISQTKSFRFKGDRSETVLSPYTGNHLRNFPRYQGVLQSTYVGLDGGLVDTI